jgi:hypothetical protein
MEMFMNSTESISSTTQTLPFLLQGLDKSYVSAPILSKDCLYVPESQTTNMLEIIEQEKASKLDISCTGWYGDTTPTTTSSVADTTYFPNMDSDESNDDEGEDK